MMLRLRQYHRGENTRRQGADLPTFATLPLLRLFFCLVRFVISAMASIFESVKAFEQLIKHLGLEDLQPRFDELGWNRFSVLAFASDFVPGASAGDAFIKEIVQPLVGDDSDRQLKYKPC